MKTQLPFSETHKFWMFDTTGCYTKFIVNEHLAFTANGGIPNVPTEEILWFHCQVKLPFNIL